MFDTITVKNIDDVKIVHIKSSLLNFASINNSKYHHTFYGCKNNKWFELSDKLKMFKKTATLLNDLKIAKPLDDANIIPNAVNHFQAYQ
jgi:hypothetical protein